MVTASQQGIPFCGLDGRMDSSSSRGGQCNMEHAEDAENYYLGVNVSNLLWGNIRSRKNYGAESVLWKTYSIQQ